MKIRWDYVTNSSSTCFIIICEGEPDKDVFLAAMGAKKGSPLRPLFDSLYGILCRKMTNAADAVHTGRWDDATSVFELVEKEFSKASARRAEKAMAQGQKVWIGKLSSHEGDVETFFCCEPFEIDHPKLYVNALRCAW
jgi:hypothetical protein